MANQITPQYMTDSMTRASKQLFNAAQDGNAEYSVATIQHVIKSLTGVLQAYDEDKKLYAQFDQWKGNHDVTNNR